jgi:hypothetical protein
MILGALCQEIMRAYQHIKKGKGKPPAWDAAYAQVHSCWCGKLTQAQCWCGPSPAAPAPGPYQKQHCHA